MEDTFRNAAERSGPSDFELARAVHKKMGYSNPALAFGVTQELIVPALKDFGTDKALSAVLHALSPDTQNIETKSLFERIFPSGRPDSAGRSLRALVFPEEKRYEERGSESNRQLARILNSLGALGRADPIQSLRRHETGEHVLHLPRNPDAARDETRVQDRLRRGAEYKSETLKLFTAELQSLLYDDRRMIGSQMQHALHIMREKIIGGDEVEKSARKVINDFGSVGALIKDGHGLNESVAILKRVEATRPRQKPGPANEVA